MSTKNSLLYNLKLCFEKDFTEKFEWENFKNELKEKVEILDIKYKNLEIPEIQNLNPKKLYIKCILYIRGNEEKIIQLEKEIKTKYAKLKCNLDFFKIETKLENKKENLECLLRPELDFKEDKEDKEDKEEISTIKVKTLKLDILVNRVGELTLAQTSLKKFKNHIKASLEEEYQSLLSLLESISKGLQEDVLAIRMIPLGNTLMQMKRIVRDTSKKFNKKIKLEIYGGETEVDKAILEKLIDPLRHMLRNSIDHGIELPEERKLKKKSEEGLIKINAYQEEGEVVIEIYDNGQGLNKEKIIEKAIKNGLLARGVGISDEEIFMLLFEHGFSTKENITEISGRGIGMDVVKKNIEKLNGKIEVTTKKDEFTLFKIRLPLTLAIIDGMFVRVGESIFVIPILNISESFQTKKNRIESIKGNKNIIEIRGEYYPLIKISEKFEIKNAIKEIEKTTVIIVETHKGKMALIVDEVIDNQQVVIKKIECFENKMIKFNEATITSDGSVALILNIKKLYDTYVQIT